MSSFLRISEGANLAIHGMTFLANRAEEPATAAEMGKAIGVSKHHLGKVLQRLAHSGLVVSRRGPKGGFILGRDADEVHLLEILEAIDGPFHPTGCLLGRSICGGDQCPLATLLESLGDQVRDFLENTKLSAMPKI